LWQTTFKKKVENNPNHAPSGDSKGGQFSKGDGGSGSDKDDNKKDTPKADPKQSLQKRGVKGDDLLNQLDSIDHFKNSGAKVNNDATVTVYHYTNSDTKDIIHKTGKMKGAEDGVFFTTKKDGDAKDFGNSLISANIPIELLNLDDDLGDELHLRIPTDKRGQSVDVSKFLNKESKCPDCGEDVALSGDHGRADVGKKKKKVAKVPRGFEFNETLDDHWKEVEHYLMEDSTNSGQKSDTVGNPEFKAFTHSSSFVGNVLWDRESREMDILLNGNKYHFCRVSERLFDSFEGAGSKGAFFNREIKTLHDC
jgi:hypothetical protein